MHPQIPHISLARLILLHTYWYMHQYLFFHTITTYIRSLPWLGGMEVSRPSMDFQAGIELLESTILIPSYQIRCQVSRLSGVLLRIVT
jgi:hypothetical protein